MESIITALITGGLALIGTALTVSSSQKKDRTQAGNSTGGHRLQD